LRDRLAIGFTLTGHDELEPSASSNAERIKAMKWLAERKYNVWASIEPVIDFDASYQMIAEATAAGCRHFKIGLLTNNTRVVRKPFAFGEHHFDAYDRAKAMQFVGYVMEMTQGLATVYWKQSFYDFFGDEPIHGMTAYEFFHQWPHSVDKDWNMFG
jgi:DNA repair photolyase